MLFLVMMEAIQPIPLSSAELSGLALEQIAYWDDLKAKGKVVFTAPFVGRRARVAVYDVVSNAELFDLINEDPLFAYLDRQVIPLSTNEQIRELYGHRLKEAGTPSESR